MAWEDPIIRRYNRRRSITAQCDPISSDITADQLLAKLKDKVEAIPLPEGYYMMWDGEHSKQVEGNKNVGAFLPLAFILMMIVIVILFNSFRQTMIIFLMLPLSFIGVANGLFVFDKAFGFMAIVGFLGLLGMVIKNAVVLIDQINVLIKERSPLEAVVESAISRMRPVMMAALTTILGMIPLINDAMYGSMAATIMFGLLFATILTLFVVPLFFCLFYKIKIVD
jgi:multidrug efflux pump subunit AcrB